MWERRGIGFTEIRDKGSEMPYTIKLLDTVALIEGVPERRLLQGQVGTVVEILEPEVFEVEFSDNNGRTYALAPLRKDQFFAS